MRKWCFPILLAAVSTAWADMATDMTPAQAFDAGKTFGQSGSGAAAVKGAISGAIAADKVPNYGTAHAHSSHYGGGDGDPRTPGGTRVSECASVTYGDAKQQAECDAINDLANNRSTRPPLAIVPADPILVQGATVKADPAAVAGAFGGAYRACQTTTVTQPATYEEEVCNEYKTLGEEGCHKTLTVTVTVSETCTPHTWYPAGTGLLTTIEAYCEPDRTDGQLYLRFTPDGLHGVCQYGYATVPKTPFTIVAGQNFRLEYVCDEFYCPGYVKHNLLTTAINHWKGACTVPVDIGYGVGAQGCTGDTCTYIFEYQDYRWGFHWVLPTNPITNPKRRVTEMDSWDNACILYEGRAQ